MYKYETHLHTSPVSKCGKATVEETLTFYKEKGFDGVFITNHFLDGNINIDYHEPYEKKIEFYFSDYENALIVGERLGIKVFLGVEMSYLGTDFLVYGLDKEWFLQHEEIISMPKRKMLSFLEENGAFIIQAHPFREASYIDHIRLYPRNVHGVEVINACRSELENYMAELYAQNYGLLKTAGSDNHEGGNASFIAGIKTDDPINNVEEFIDAIKNEKTELFFEACK